MSEKEMKTCPTCGGTGRNNRMLRHRGDNCPACDGAGMLEKSSAEMKWEKEERERKGPLSHSLGDAIKRMKGAKNG